MARRVQRTFRKGPKRGSLWVPFDVQCLLTTGGTRVQSGDILQAYFTQTGEEVPIGSTIGPVRGKARMLPSSPTAIDRAFVARCALQLNREGGRATLPSPEDDIMDGMWYGDIFYTNVLTEVSAGIFQGATVVEPFETKAKRKITGNGQTLTVTADPSSSIDFQLDFVGHMFLMLP